MQLLQQLCISLCLPPVHEAAGVEVAGLVPGLKLWVPEISVAQLTAIGIAFILCVGSTPSSAKRFAVAT